VEGVISFDIARDLSDPNSFIATEVFEDADARERQESMPQVGKVMALMPESLAAPPEATVYHVSSSEPAMP
jgi:quinol monooxygenase YgiN